MVLGLMLIFLWRISKGIFLGFFRYNYKEKFYIEMFLFGISLLN